MQLFKHRPGRVKKADLIDNEEKGTHLIERIILVAHCLARHINFQQCN